VFKLGVGNDDNDLRICYVFPCDGETDRRPAYTNNGRNNTDAH